MNSYHSAKFPLIREIIGLKSSTLSFCGEPLKNRKGLVHKNGAFSFFRFGSEETGFETAAFRIVRGCGDSVRSQRLGSVGKAFQGTSVRERLRPGATFRGKNPVRGPLLSLRKFECEALNKRGSRTVDAVFRHRTKKPHFTRWGKAQKGFGTSVTRAQRFSREGPRVRISQHRPPATRSEFPAGPPASPSPFERRRGIRNGGGSMAAPAGSSSRRCPPTRGRNRCCPRS